MESTQSFNSEIVELSVSSWFYRNRTIAGFDNPARSLYVSVRELVENSLDACEEADALPQVAVSLKAKNEKKHDTDVFSMSVQTFTLRITDNGSGIHRERVPLLIGKMLTGTKFQHKQSRGTFGLGGSLALLYGQITTQKPIHVRSGLRGREHYYDIEIRLDIEKNLPVILREEKKPKPKEEHGTEIEFELQGDWIRSKRKIVDYFYQTSIIAPYVSLIFETPDGECYEYSRLISEMPELPREMKPHPRGIDVEMLKKMIGQAKSKTLESFMKTAFQRVGASTAAAFLEYAEYDSGLPLESLNDSDLVNLMRAFDSYESFLAPSSSSLSPAGAKVLRAGLKRLSPDFIVVRERNPNVYEGHPFIVETAVAYGGDIPSGITIYRYANKIPLLYDEGSDVSTKVLRELNLKNYRLKPDDPLVFLVHICSTKIPYKTVGKEYIGDVDVLRKEIDLGFKDCLRRLSKKVNKRNRAKREMKREGELKKYYGFIIDSLSEFTGRGLSLDRLFPEGGIDGE